VERAIDIYRAYEYLGDTNHSLVHCAGITY